MSEEKDKEKNEDELLIALAKLIQAIDKRTEDAAARIRQIEAARSRVLGSK